MKGTLEYMSPEMIKREKYSYESDIWSLGVSFYQLMTYKLPFEGDSQIHIMEKIKGVEYSKIEDKIYSQELKDIIYKMLSEARIDRPTPDDIFKFPIIKKRMLSYLIENNYNNLFTKYLIQKYKKNVYNKENKKNKNDSGNNNKMEIEKNILLTDDNFEDYLNVIREENEKHLEKENQILNELEKNKGSDILKNNQFDLLKLKKNYFSQLIKEEDLDEEEDN